MAQEFSGVNVFLTIGGVTYTPDDLQLTKLEVTDSDEGDNELEAVCVDNDFRIADSPVIRVGVLMSVKWGYTLGRSSQERQGYVLMKPSVHYTNNGVETTLKAFTKSATLAARQPRKVYGATSVRQIVSEIAIRNGLTLNIVGGNEKLNAFSTANWTDRQVLRVLADRYGYQLSFSSGEVTFAPIDYGAVPALELVYSDGEQGNIINAELNVDARHAMGDSSTVAGGVDPFSKLFQSATSGDADKTVAISAEDGHSWLTTAAQKVADVGGVFEMPKISNSLPDDVVQHMTSPDVNNLLASATGEKLKKQKKKGELSIESLGIVDAICRKIVRVQGLAKRDSGNWYVQSVRHDISKQSGYSCHWELARHGNNTQGGATNPEPLNNQSPSKSSGESTVDAVAISAETGKPLK